jgi:hypothetical protein
MGRRSTVIRAVLAAVFFGLGFQVGTPAQPLPDFGSDQYGYLSKASRAQVTSASRAERRLWGEELRDDEAMLRRQIDELLGPPEPWPDDLSPEMEADAFPQEVVQEFVEAIDMDPARIDCEGYPCLVSFALPMTEEDPDDAEDYFLDIVLVRNELFRRWGKQRVSWSSERNIHVDADGGPWLLISVGLLPAEAPDSLQRQVSVRSAMELIRLRSENDLVPADL